MSFRLNCSERGRRIEGKDQERRKRMVKKIRVIVFLIKKINTCIKLWYHAVLVHLL